jgi:hypothetical protein
MYNSYPCYKLRTDLCNSNHWSVITATNAATTYDADTNSQINTFYRLGTPWKRKITAPHAASTSICHGLSWRCYPQLPPHFIRFCIPMIRPYGTTIFSVILQHLVAHITGKKWLRGYMICVEGCFTTRTRGRYLGPRWLNRRVEKMAQWAWMIG